MGVAVAACDSVAGCVGEADGVRSCEGVSDGEGEGVRDAEGLAVSDGDPEDVMLAEWLVDCEAETLCEPVRVAEFEGEGEGGRDAACERVRESVGLDERDADRLGVARWLCDGGTGDALRLPLLLPLSDALPLLLPLPLALEEAV